MKILIAQTGFLGDVVLSTPVITNLRKSFPEGEIVFLTTPEAKSLVQFHTDLNRVLVFDKRGEHAGFQGLKRMAEVLRKEQFDKVFSLHKSFRSAALFWWAGIPERFGFREAEAWWLYTRTVRRDFALHDALRNLMILEAGGFYPTEPLLPLSIGIPSEAEEQATQLLAPLRNSQKPLIGLAPGSVWATKRWTPEGFLATQRHFSELGYPVVLLGGPKDAEIGTYLTKEGNPHVLNLIGKCSLVVTGAIVQKLSVLVTNDSAPLHIASAVGTPVVCIFAATVPEFGFGPWQVPAEVVGVEGLTCRPCGRHGGNTCPTGTHACQKGVKPAWVIDAVERLLLRRSSNGKPEVVSKSSGLRSEAPSAFSVAK